MGREKGISLITVILIIALIFISALVTVPFLFKIKEAYLKKKTESELRELYRAVIGDGRNYFGYHGDLGVIPPQLRDLVEKGNQLDFPAGIGPTGNEQQVGWKGPYYSPKRWDGNNILDPYGHPYVNDIDTNNGTWQIRSMGPDGIDNGGGGDDITVMDPIQIETYGGYAYIPSTVRFSINVGKFTGAQNSSRPGYFRVYLPLYNNATYRDFMSTDGVVSHVPMGQRFVLAALYQRNYTSSGEVCAFFYTSDYGDNGGAIVTFPFEIEGKFAVNWPFFMDTLTDLGSYCVRWGSRYRIYIYVRSSMTWQYPNCNPISGGDGETLKVTGLNQNYEDMNFSNSGGYFYYTFTVRRRDYNPPFTFLITTNSGATLNINMNSCF